MALLRGPTAYRFRAGAAAILMAGLLLLPGFALPAAALTARDIGSETAVLMDADTGQVLFSKAMNKSMHPASITKIMTGMLALEYNRPQAMLTVSSSAVALPPGSSHIALGAGERISLEDALYALMLPSANDAANAIAEHISGSQADFAVLMNRRAQLLGCTKTHFTNAHGLPDDAHLTTAYDMALITRAAIQSEAFMTYFGAGSRTLAATNLAPARPVSSSHFMLVEGSGYYNGDVIAGKVGYTRLAGHTMSTVARRDGRTLICVVMNTSRDQKFRDTERLFAFGFEEFDQWSGEAALPPPVPTFNTARTATTEGGPAPASPAATIKRPADITWLKAVPQVIEAHPYAIIGLIVLLMAAALVAILMAVRAILRESRPPSAV